MLQGEGSVPARNVAQRSRVCDALIEETSADV